jgi:hypothetical protein
MKMTQRRLVNFGDPVTAERVQLINQALQKSFLLDGFGLTVTDTDKFETAAGSLILPNGVVLLEDHALEYTVTITPAAENYTLVYRHTDVDILGGATATVTLESGLITDALPDGTVVMWLVYPGGSVNITDDMLFPAPTPFSSLDLEDYILNQWLNNSQFFDVPYGFDRSTVDLSAAPTTASSTNWVAGQLLQDFVTATTNDIITLTFQGFIHGTQPRRVSFGITQSNTGADATINCYDSTDVLIATITQVGTGIALTLELEIPEGIGDWVTESQYRFEIVLQQGPGEQASMGRVYLMNLPLPYNLIP